MSQKLLHLGRGLTMMVAFYRQHCHSPLFWDYPPWSKEKLPSPIGADSNQAWEGFWLTAASQLVVND